MIERVFALTFLMLYFPLLQSTISGQTRDITINQISVADGLSQSTITSLHVDAFSRVWVGTGNGLNLLEGSQVKTISDNVLYPRTIPEITVRNISSMIIPATKSKMESTHIFVGTERGAFVMNNHGKLLSSFVDSAQNDKMLKLFGSNRYMIFLSREGVVKFKENNTRKTSLIKSSIIEGPNSISIEGNQLYWISSFPKAIFCFDLLSGRYSQIKISDHISPISIDANQKHLIISTKDSVFQYVIEERKWIPLNIKFLYQSPSANDYEIKFVKEDYQNRKWVGILGKGILVFDEKLNLINSYTGIYINHFNTNFNLERLTTIDFDSSGNAFVGTDGNGLIKINPGIRKFEHLLPSVISNGTLKDNFVTTLEEVDDSTIIFATLNSGLTVFNKINRKYRLINIITSNEKTPQLIYKAKKISPQNYLIGTELGLFLLTNFKTLTPISPRLNNIKCIENLNDSLYLLGGLQGLFIYSNRKIKKITSGQINQIGLIKKTGNNEFIISESGDRPFLMKFLKNDTIFVPLDIPNHFHELKTNYLSSAQTKKGLYIGSSNGLLFYDNNLTFKKLYNTTDGLEGMHIYSILKDKNENLWLGTNKGLFYFHTDNHVFTQFRMEHGLQSMEFNTGAALATADYKMYFGGVNGINAFNPDSVLLFGNIPKINLNSIVINDLNKISIDENTDKSIRLRFNENNLSFDVSVIENTYGKAELFVMLKNFDKKYESFGNRTKLNFSNLPPAKYELWVKAKNADGLFTQPVKLIDFEIIPPFYKRIWFIIFSIILGLGLLTLIFYLIYLQKLKKKIREIRTLQEIEKIRLRISREIHDDIGAGLTQIALISEQLSFENSQNEDIFLAKKLQRLQEISRELIQSMSEIVWYINPEHDSLENLLIYIRLLINRITENSTLTSTIDFPISLPNLTVKSNVKRHLSLMIKEAINNILRHSNASEFYVKFQIDNGLFKFEVSDNGKGFDITKKTYGNGLNNFSKRCSEMEIQFEIFSQVAKGTKIVFLGALEKITTKR